MVSSANFRTNHLPDAGAGFSIEVYQSHMMQLHESITLRLHNNLMSTSEIMEIKKDAF